MRLVVAGCILAGVGLPSRGHAQQAAVADPTRSTRAGVFSAAQVALGQDLYAMSCASCHSAASHTGPAFVAKWEGRRLWELFRFVSESMPKSEPGSLSQREYGRVLAYLLKMNGMPAGPDELPADSTALTQIRIELQAVGDSSHSR